MKNKIRKITGTISAALLTVPALAMAQFSEPTGTALPEGTLLGIARNFMNWILIFIGILGVIGFVIAGILYLTAAGDEDRIKTAKSAMIYSIIGVIVALLGIVILRAAAGFLGGANTAF